MQEPEKLVKKTLVDHGFQEWLGFLKQKWKLQRTQRKTLQSEIFEFPKKILKLKSKFQVLAGSKRFFGTLD